MNSDNIDAVKNVKHPEPHKYIHYVIAGSMLTGLVVALGLYKLIQFMLN